MLWMIGAVFILLIICTWLEDENRLYNRRIYRMADASRKLNDVHKPNNKPWPPYEPYEGDFYV